MMGFIAEHMAGRRDQRDLGRGVWRRAHDRFRRGLDRFYQVLEHVQDQEVMAQAVPVANDVADLLPRVRAVCVQAQRIAPDENQEIPYSPGGWLHDVHRELSRAGNDLAQAAEALAIARFYAAAAGDGGEYQSIFYAVERRCHAVKMRVAQAEHILEKYGFA